MKIRFITTGGTFDKVYFDALSAYQVGPPGVERILQELPLVFEYQIQSILRKDSLDLSDDDRLQIRHAVEASPERQIIITHGTDTMIETARALTGIPDRCIVLTGALQPAGFRNSDAIFNVGVAVGAVQSLPDGVYIAMNGRIFDPARTRKNRERGIFETI
ncbi:MAG: asparaginase domain-containing protein [Planctomyces sp.]